MRKLSDLFYSRARFKDRVIAIKQVVDLIEKEIQNEEWDLGLIADYILELSGHISVLSRWVRKIVMLEMEKKKESKVEDTGKV